MTGETALYNEAFREYKIAEAILTRMNKIPTSELTKAQRATLAEASKRRHEAWALLMRFQH